MLKSTSRRLTTREKRALANKEGHGQIRVLCVGVSDYPEKSGFKPLRQCANDAFQVQSAFIEVRQLNAHEEHIVLLSSGSRGSLPSRGSILDQLHELASSAEEADRILFYFSGHGHRINGIEDHFLVPQDAYSAEKSDALVSMKEVMGVLKGSVAKQKIIILDACLSGPTLLGKKLLAASYSDKFFAEYLAATKGMAVLSSSAADEASYTKSDNPKLSLFTSYLVNALRGEPEALDGQLLTLPKLFDYVSTKVNRKCRDYRLQQTPSLESTVSGTLVLADFRKPIVAAAAAGLKEHAVEGLVFRHRYGERTKAILTEWSNPSKTKEQLEYAANTPQAMEAYLSSNFGEWRPALRKQFKFATSDIEAVGSTMTFPGGSLEYSYKADTKQSGQIYRKLSVDVDWFGDGPRLAALLELFDFSPKGIELKLGATLMPLEQIAGLEANEWEVQSESEDKVVARKDGVEITIRPRSLRFEGVEIEQLLSARPTEERKKLMQTLVMITPQE